MKTIYKYTFRVSDDVIIPMPMGARILPYVVALSGVTLVIWAEVDTDRPNVNRDLHVVGTGNPMPDNLGRHIGSTVADLFVWHVYEGDPS